MNRFTWDGPSVLRNWIGRGMAPGEDNYLPRMKTARITTQLRGSRHTEKMEIPGRGFALFRSHRLFAKREWPPGPHGRECVPALSSVRNSSQAPHETRLSAK